MLLRLFLQALQSSCPWSTAMTMKPGVEWSVYYCRPRSIFQIFILQITVTGSNDASCLGASSSSGASATASSTSSTASGTTLVTIACFLVAIVLTVEQIGRRPRVRCQGLVDVRFVVCHIRWSLCARRSRRKWSGLKWRESPNCRTPYDPWSHVHGPPPVPIMIPPLVAQGFLAPILPLLFFIQVTLSATLSPLLFLLVSLQGVWYNVGSGAQIS